MMSNYWYGILDPIGTTTETLIEKIEREEEIVVVDLLKKLHGNLDWPFSDPMNDAATVIERLMAELKITI